MDFCERSGLRKHPSTEATLPKVLNYILLTGDYGDHAVLVLIDLSVFDTVDHAILLASLEH